MKNIDIILEHSKVVFYTVFTVILLISFFSRNEELLLKYLIKIKSFFNNLINGFNVSIFLVVSTLFLYCLGWYLDTTGSNFTKIKILTLFEIETKDFIFWVFISLIALLNKPILSSIIKSVTRDKIEEVANDEFKIHFKDKVEEIVKEVVTKTDLAKAILAATNVNPLSVKNSVKRSETTYDGTEVK